jgi:YHS domain-containing protein
MEFLADNWLYFATAGLMAFMMFKGGGCCGGHNKSMHSNNGKPQSRGCCGGHKNTNQIENNKFMEEAKYNDSVDVIKDPICGMIVNPDTAIKEKIGDETYYFCREHCRIKFINSQKLIK